MMTHDRLSSTTLSFIYLSTNKTHIDDFVFLLNFNYFLTVFLPSRSEDI